MLSGDWMEDKRAGVKVREKKITRTLQHCAHAEGSAVGVVGFRSGWVFLVCRNGDVRLG